MTYKLYSMDGAGSFVVEAALTELGLEHELIALSKEENGHQQADYLALNPRGQIPALVLPDGTVMTETAACLLHLVDCHPSARLAPEAGTAQRATLYRWLIFAAVNLYEEDLRYYYARRYTTDTEGYKGVRAAAAQAFEEHAAIINEELKKTEGPFLFGSAFSVFDVYLAMLVAWHWDYASFAERNPQIADLVAAVRARPAIAPLWQKHYGDWSF
ncbi:glutathione S-transferase family protein [Rhodovibrionaceae bacterium A322]